MPRQERAIRTRGLILRAAAEAIRENGYDGASTTDVMRRAGVTRGALYFHFPSKEALADTILEHQVPLLQGRADQSPLQAVVDITFGYACALQEDVVLQAAVRLAVEETSYSPGSTPYLWPQKSLTDLLNQARATGELLPNIDVEDVAAMIVGAFTGIQLLSQLTTCRADLLKRVAVLWRTTLPGIAAPGMLMHVETDEARARRLYAERKTAPRPTPGQQEQPQEQH